MASPLCRFPLTSGDQPVAGVDELRVWSYRRRVVWFCVVDLAGLSPSGYTAVLLVNGSVETVLGVARVASPLSVCLLISAQIHSGGGFCSSPEDAVRLLCVACVCGCGLRLRCVGFVSVHARDVFCSKAWTWPAECSKSVDLWLRYIEPVARLACMPCSLVLFVAVFNGYCSTVGGTGLVLTSLGFPTYAVPMLATHRALFRICRDSGRQEGGKARRVCYTSSFSACRRSGEHIVILISVQRVWV